MKFLTDAFKIGYSNFILSFFCVLMLNHSYFLCASDCNQCVTSDCKTNSKTFFRPRSVIEDVSFLLGLNWYNYYRSCFEPCAYDSDNRAHFTMGALFEKSHLTDKNNLGKLFFQGDTNPSLTPNPDLVESIITISPERTIVGAYFDYHQDFCCRCSFWLDVKMAFYQATHNLHAEECDLGLESSCTPLSFLSSDLLQFGRIPITKLKEFNVDDIEVKLGHNFYNKGGYVGVYGSALLPIAPKPTAEFLFEPLVGRGHWGLGIGINAAHTFCRSETKSLTFLADFSYQYLFNRNELRSLDFKTGQLTRFIVLNTEVGTDPIAAINVTTLNLGVTPRGIINFWLASHLQYCQCHVELGYNLWWRQSEKICYPTCLQTNFDSLGVIDSTDTFTPLTLDSLDLASAASSSTLTNKLYIAFSCDANMCLSPNIGLGASYEISKNINSIGQWGVWLNIGLNL